MFWSKKPGDGLGSGSGGSGASAGLGEAAKDSKSVGCCRDSSGALPGKFPITDDSEGSQGVPVLFAVVVHHRLGFSVRGPRKALVGSIGPLGDRLSAFGKAVTFQQPMKPQTVN